MKRVEKIGDNGAGIGTRIRKAREAAGLSTNRLAAMIGVTEGALRQIESGLIKTPNAIIVLRIARELYVDPNALAFGDEGARRLSIEANAPAPTVVETFGARLRRLREQNALTFAALATTVRCSEGTLRQLEGGAVKSPSLVLGVRIADALGVDPRYLATGDDGVIRGDLERRVRALERRLAAVERG